MNFTNRNFRWNLDRLKYFYDSMLSVVRLMIVGVQSWTDAEQAQAKANLGLPAGVDDVPTAGSGNLVTSGGVARNESYFLKKESLGSHFLSQKNLININDLLYGKTIIEGQWVDEETGICTNKLFFNPGVRYAMQGIGCYGNNRHIYMGYFDHEDVFLGRVSLATTLDDPDINRGKATFTFSADTFPGAAYCRVVLQNHSTAPLDTSLCQIEVGSEHTAVVGFEDVYELDYVSQQELSQSKQEAEKNLSRSEKITSRGILIDYSHILNIASEVRYKENTNYDCIQIVLSGQDSIELQNVNSVTYRFFDSLDLFSGEDVAAHYLGYNRTGKVLENAQMCVVNASKSNNPDGLDNIRLISRFYMDDESKAAKKSIRLLCIGNSYSQDALSYVPFILQNMGIDADIQIGILMMSSSTLQNHVDNFNNETAAYTFNYYIEGDSWNALSNKTIQWALDNYEWDVIILQQASGSVFNWSTYQPYLNQLINLIGGYIDYNVKFGWYAVQSKPASVNSGANWDDATISSHYESIAENAEKVMTQTTCEFLVPVCTAIQNARSIAAIKALGAYAQNEKNTSGLGYLTPNDGVHLQEGLPCQIAAYSFILAILKLYGFEHFSIIGETTRVTAEWASGKSIPGPHGDYIGSTDENSLIAQKCAIMAMKHPYEVTDMNSLINPS